MVSVLNATRRKERHRSNEYVKRNRITLPMHKSQIAEPFLSRRHHRRRLLLLRNYCLVAVVSRTEQER
jgi:hypothetical protein